jgi:hypothetical protein
MVNIGSDNILGERAGRSRKRMKGEWTRTSAKCLEYIGIDEAHKLYGKVVEENGVYCAWYISGDGNLKKAAQTFDFAASAKTVVEGMAESLT